MYDYAQAQLLGRATTNAHLTKDDDDHITKAVFTLALNIPMRRGRQLSTRTLFRRVMVLGSFAAYVANCQEDDGLKGRLINVVGVMDDEHIMTDEEEDGYYEVIRVAPGAGFIKIMDRRAKSNDR